MYNILKNFNDAADGKKPSASKADAGSMKAILESLDKVTKVDECSAMPMAGQSAPQQQGNPVTMSISLNASGKENVDELMALLKGAGITPSSAPSMSGPSEPPDMGKLRAMVMKPEMPEMEEEPEIEVNKEEWDNSPDEQYSDHETMTKDLSGGINRQKKMYKQAARGDNPMAVESVKDRLWAALNEKKTLETRSRRRSDPIKTIRSLPPEDIELLVANKDKLPKDWWEQPEYWLDKFKQDKPKPTRGGELPHTPAPKPKPRPRPGSGEISSDDLNRQSQLRVGQHRNIDQATRDRAAAAIAARTQGSN